MANLVYSNGIKFRIKNGLKVLDVIEDAMNAEILEREYKGSCWHPSVHYHLYIVVAYKDKTYRFSLSSNGSNYSADITIEMFTEMGFKQIANTQTLGYGKIDRNLNDVHHLSSKKTTEEQREMARGVVERMIDYISLLS